MSPAGDVSETGKLVPDVSSRFFTEDITFGLVVIRGIAELAGVATPAIDQVLTWCQEMMGKDFIVDGRLTGRNVEDTRAPQRYGFSDLESFMKWQQYI
jgi:hypothetical protein